MNVFIYSIYVYIKEGSQSFGSYPLRYILYLSAAFHLSPGPGKCGSRLLASKNQRHTISHCFPATGILKHAASNLTVPLNFQEGKLLTDLSFRNISKLL